MAPGKGDSSHSHFLYLPRSSSPDLQGWLCLFPGVSSTNLSMMIRVTTSDQSKRCRLTRSISQTPGLICISKESFGPSPLCLGSSASSKTLLMSCPLQFKFQAFPIWHSALLLGSAQACYNSRAAKSTTRVAVARAKA